MATLEQVVQQEKAWIAACDDVDALIEKIGDYREDVRVAEREGHQLMRMRAGDLVELAQGRVVLLKARELRAAAADAPRARPAPLADDRPVPPRPQPPKAAQEQPDRVAARRRQESAATGVAEKARAAARLAVAEAARVELQNELLKARVEAARRVTVAPAGKTTPAGPAPRQAEPRKPPAAPSAPSTAGGTARTAAAPPEPSVSHEDQLALMSVGRWPPSGPPPGHPFYSRDQDWPADWSLTGLDLARFRGGIHVTQKVLAAQLGVSTTAIAGLERRPRQKVGPAMQIALRKAMDMVAAGERRKREEAAAERATRVVAVAAQAATSTAAVGMTGGDLARLRAERKLSQRQFAEVLGVGYGMVAKAEVAAAEPLGERMRTAVGALLAAGAGGAAK